MEAWKRSLELLGIIFLPPIGGLISFFKNKKKIDELSKAKDEYLVYKREIESKKLNFEEIKKVQELEDEIGIKAQEAFDSHKNFKKLEDRNRELHQEIENYKNSLAIDLGNNQEIDQLKNIRRRYGLISDKFQELIDYRQQIESIGTEDDFRLIKKLKNEYGSLERIYRTMEEYQEIFRKLQETKVLYEKTKEDKDKFYEELNNLKNKIGGEEELEKIRYFKNEHGGFDVISNKLNTYKEKSGYIDQLIEMESLVSEEENSYILHQLNENLREKKRIRESFSSDNPNKYGKYFEDECLSEFEKEYGKIDNIEGYVRWRYQEDKKTDIIVDFEPTGNHQFKVYFECKSFEKWKEFGEIKIKPLITEEDRKAVIQQIAKAKSQLDKKENKDLGIIILNMNVETLESLNIKTIEEKHKDILIIGRDQLPATLNCLKILNQKYKPKENINIKISEYSGIECKKVTEECIKLINSKEIRNKKTESIYKLLESLHKQHAKLEKYLVEVMKNDKEVEEIIHNLLSTTFSWTGTHQISNQIIKTLDKPVEAIETEFEEQEE